MAAHQAPMLTRPADGVKRYFVTQANTSNAATSVPTISDAPNESNAPSSTQTPISA
jgi:hypothetical protein